jgi:subtilisin family serine protease
MSPHLRSFTAFVSLLCSLLFATGAMGAPPPRAIPDEVLIKFRPGSAASDRAAIRANLHARVMHDFKFIGVEHLKIQGTTVDAALSRYRNNPNVVYVEPNYEIQALVTPNDPRFPEMYALRNTGQTGGTAGDDIKAALAWDQFTGDPSIKIGVIDTGVDYNHPDLAANIWTNPGEIPGNGIDDDGNGYVDDVHGYDFANSDGDPFDDNGHGTHTSGTIAAIGNNNLGVTGVNWNAKIVAIKFLSGSGSGSTAGAIAGIGYSITVGVRLTSNSWGGGGFSQALLDAINAAGAAGQLFVAAAGNSAQNTDATPSYPASYDTPYIISVAATDHNDALASFSNYGATTVDIGAPGVNILSTLPGNSYGLLSGTSMATPHVAGVVGLAMGRFPAMANLQVKQLVMNAADARASLAGKCVTGGRLNAFMTIAEPDSIPPGSIADLSTSDPGSNTMRLAWTATGDDGSTGRATRYEIRYSTAPITDANFGSATLIAGGPDPQSAGHAETFDVTQISFSTTYFFAIKAFDEFNNAGGLSNVATGTTLGAPNISVSPPSLAAELLTGAAVNQTLTVRNTAAGTLDFTIPTPELQFSQPVVYPYEPYAKTDPDTRVGRPVTESKGGPDGFGYRWKDSDEPGGPSFNWVDITGTGALLTLSGDDGTSAPVPLGMSFPFYGGSFTQARINTNGYLSFTSTTSAYDNQGLPNTGAPENLVAPMWDDMDFGSSNRVYTYNDGTRFIVSWVAVPHYESGGPYTFQAILYPTGEIRYQYLDLGSVTNSATAGIQDGTKSVGLTVAYNTTYLKNNLAVQIVPLQQWLTVSPTSGRVLAGQSQDVQVRFNALGLNGGTFNGAVRVLSNDPVHGTLPVPASLHVIGAPDIAVNPAAVDFGSIFVGATPTRTVTVSNPGTDNLVISGITSSDPTLTASPSTFTLAPLAAQIVTITFHPTAPATLAATLTIASNDPDNPSLTVGATGAGVPAPSFSVSPDHVAAALLTNTATTQSLRITNSGGSNYVFTAEALTNAPSGTVVVGTDADNVFIDKGRNDVQSGPAPLKAGGPDVFGYTYQDSDDPSGPAFAWVDIRTLGTQVNLTGDDANAGPIPIGFSFPFYGKTFSSLRACTNGWLSFTSTATSYSNTTLPNNGSGVPENLLAIFWDDMNFSTTKRAWYYNDGTRLIVQYQDVPKYNETATNTFEAILYPTGQIVYQYLTMNGTKTSATIGVQNEARNDGLQVAFNATYIKNNLAIRFRPPARFLTVSPTGGTVPPGGFTDLTVGLNAADLFGGIYTGAVRVRGNDPVLPQQDVPVQLTVTGVPDVAASPSPIDFGNVFIGFPGIRPITIQNRGTDVLNVSNITLGDASYGVDQTTFSIPPLGNAQFFLSFNPPSPGPRPATLTIASNDPDTPMYTVPVTGAGVIPPDIATDPTSVAATLPIPATTTQTLTVRNEGGSNLDFVVGTNLTASAVPVYDELALGKDQPDPRQGIKGTGGPDVFGYTWRDSDDPNGPSFDWVDITSIGTRLTLTGDDNTSQGIPIGFNFPFYGTSFADVNVCTNGWLSFTSTLTAYSNQPLPNSGSGVPENLIAPFWDDLDALGGQPAYVYRDGTRFIVSYVGIARHSGGGSFSFQTILYPSGRIVCQYLDMQGTLNDATVGIQNAAKNDGLTVIYNAAYVKNHLAVEFRTTPDWLIASPTSGTIPAGGSLPLTLTFNSDGLFGGPHAGSLRLSSNDPDEGVLNLPATLTAVGVPHVAANPASIDFGTIYVSQHGDRTIEVRNSGTDVLQITGLTLSNPSYALVGPPQLPLTLGDGGVQTLTVRFLPTGACSPCAGELAIASNDPNGAAHVSLTGVALIPPEAETSPASLRAALATTLGPTAIHQTKTLRLSNTGGSDLNWSASALSLLPAAINTTPSPETGKDQSGNPRDVSAQMTGGPDAFGYRYADSDDPVQGAPFDWIDISSTGTAIPFTKDDENLGPFPLPFPFTFYGNTFTSFYACSNGWVSFTNTTTKFTNTGLPNASTDAPENLLAPFWDDLDLRTSGHVYYHYDGARFVVAWVDAPHFSTGGPYTFEIILYPSGTIDYQYLGMNGTRLNEATIGVQNQTRDIGLQVAFNQPYVKNNLRVRFTDRPGWLTISPNAGMVPAGGYADLAVGFDATGLADGGHSGAVRVQSNDLTNPIIDVEATLHVGVAAAQVVIDPNTLNRASSGNWLSAMLEPPSGYDPNRILTPGVLLQRQVPVATGAPVNYGDKDADGLPDAEYKFGRTEALAALPSGNAVPVELIGEVDGETWLSGTGTVRVLPPRMIRTAGLGEQKGTTADPPVYSIGARLDLAWDDPEGYPATSYELWYSADGGATWSAVASGITARAYSFVVPAPATDQGMIELVAVDDQGPMGSWSSDPFTVQLTPTGVDAAETTIPKEYGLRFLSMNPVGREDLRLELGIPKASPVDVRVYDVRGALVRRVLTRDLAPGFHRIQWNGRNESGRAVGSGIYFMQMKAGGRTITERFAVVR